MPLLCRGLIDSYYRYGRVVLTAPGFCNVVAEHPPELIVIFSNNSGNGVHGHLPHHGHGQRFEEEGKVSATPGPWNLSLEDAVFRAFDSGHAGGKIAGILEEVEMSPLLF